MSAKIYASQEWVEEKIHHLDPKYIKDMYYEESTELFSVENVEFENNQYVCESPFAIVDGNTYVVNWDGVEYVCESYVFGGIPAIGNTAPFGGIGNNEPFVIGYSSSDNVPFVNNFDDLTTHTFSVTKLDIHTIAPKYIKDMYYENKIHYLVDGNFVNININQTYTVKVKDDVYENVPVNNARSDNDPTWGFGSGTSGSFTSYPFCIRKYPSWPNNDIFNGKCNAVMFDTTVYPDATIDDVEIYQINLKQIDDTKYIPDTIARVENTISSPSVAQVGQILSVKSVDANGKPTEWEAVDPFILTDEVTSKKYKLSIIDATLTMTEVDT